MVADPHLGLRFERNVELPEAIYFDSGDHKLFGWFHRPPSGSVANSGVVICNPFGYEAICSHRSVRSIAEAATSSGIPTLRFDYSGTGDSPDIEPLADQVQIWSHDIVSAVLELQKRAGVKSVCLIGIRLGALLATLAADHCKAITSLALVAPIISGRRYLRELRTLRLAASIGAEAIASVRSPSDVSQAVNNESVEVSGFSLSAATLQALGLLDLAARDATPVRRMLVIDGNTMATSRGWVDKLAGSGADIKYLALPGMIEMIMTAPHQGTVPQQMVAAIKEWLPNTLDSEPQSWLQMTDRRSTEIGLARMDSALTLPTQSQGICGSITERPVFFGAEVLLFGIVTEPPVGEQRRRAVIFLNAGADYHIGASGIYVELARRWAARGYVVLRMDLAGLGDSATRPGRLDDEVFPPAAIDDVRAALEFMRMRYDVREFTMAGICSGAYHVLRAAVEALPINRIMMVNPQNFFWKNGMTVDDMQVAELVSNPRVYRGQIMSAAAWRRLLTGKINISYILKIYAHRILLTLESTLRDWARYLRIRLPRDLGWELEEVGSRGVRVVFVFARGEPGIDLLKIQGGSSITRLGERCHIHTVDSADHVFSKRGPRESLQRILSDELFAKPDWNVIGDGVEAQIPH